MKHRYRAGRKAEQIAAEHLRCMGLNVIRVPLSKGFYVVDNLGTVYSVRGDLAVWVSDGIPVPVEVKRIYRCDNDGLLRRLRRVLSRCESGVLVVVVLQKKEFRYFIYFDNRRIEELSKDEFLCRLRERSVLGLTKVRYTIIPMG